MVFELVTIKNQALALLLNIYDWTLSFIPYHHHSKSIKNKSVSTGEKCVAIYRPGGYNQLQVTSLGDRVTLGYNVKDFKPPFAEFSDKSSLPAHVVIVKVHYFSVNYADVCIRWGLYESALRYVGWPIVPGFDFSGSIEWAGSESGFVVGEKVYGFSLFGTYSSRLLVPGSQIRLVPPHIDMEVAAGIPAVAGTALHALSLAGSWPLPLITNNKAALIHSAAGGVGSMLVQMCKLLGYSPVVAIVGSSHKIDFCRRLGADVVIDKSKLSSQQLWKQIKAASPNGYASAFDANGVATLRQSYDHLTRCGRLVTYGFHSNVPHTGYLSPFAWIRMIYGLLSMPKFDAMDMVLDSKAVLGFNLSFFADEHELIEKYMSQISIWVDKERIIMPDVTIFDIQDIAKAHELIQSGRSIGKIVIKAQ